MARSLASSALRAASHSSRETIGWFMVSLLDRAVGQVRGRLRPEANFSQGDRWNRLISRYIAVMGSVPGMLEPEEQSAIGGASFAAIHAMSAKVGEAARPSQPAAPRGRQAHPLPLSAAEDVVIFWAPDRLSPFLAAAGPSEDLGRPDRRVRVTSVTGFRWTR